MLKHMMALFLAGLSFMPAQAYYADYLPAALVARIHQAPQRLISDKVDNDWSCEVLKGVTATNKDGNFVVEGTDKNGKQWQVTDPEQRSLGGSCFVADVDKNGHDDIILWWATGSCGYPFSIVSIYFFDDNGVAHRDEALSRFSVKKTGVPDILEAADGKGAYVLIQDLGYGADHSYWRFSMMRAQNCKLSDVKKAFGAHFPSWVLFTNKPNHLLSKHSASLETAYRNGSSK